MATPREISSARSRKRSSSKRRGAPTRLSAHLALLDRALANTAAPHAVEAVLASVDALVTRTVPSLERIGNDHAIAFRHPGAMKTVADHLARNYEAASLAGPFVRGVIAQAALELALHDGNAALAQTWRQRTGCARAATVVGPLDWAPITAVSHETPLEGATQPIAASYRGSGRSWRASSRERAGGRM